MEYDSYSCALSQIACIETQYTTTNIITVKYQGHKANYSVKITPRLENITENPPTGITKIIIIIFTFFISLITGCIYYRKIQLNIK